MKAKLNYFSALLFNTGTKGAGITRQTVNAIVNKGIFINLNMREIL
jgi:hypothetical protein